ncbi:MAG: SUMF1/EgtB/PvdO family nonheme iron enzyme, partial [Phototrophicaceae bacterium]
MKKLFISYSRDDKAWVSLLWQALRDENYDAWMDRFIDPVANWWEAILSNIRDADCFIYVMSPKAIESPYCTAELNYALDRNVPVLPLMLKRCDFPKRLSDANVQYLVVGDNMSLYEVLFRMGRGLNVAATITQRYEVKFPNKPGAEQDPAEAMLIAEDAAANGNFAEAIRLLEEVSQKDDGVLGIVAAEKLQEVQALAACGKEYAKIKKVMVGNSADLARRAWAAYQKTPCASYDPDDLAAQFTVGTRNGAADVQPTSPVNPSPQPPPPTGEGEQKVPRFTESPAVGTRPASSAAPTPIQPDPVARQKVPLPIVSPAVGTRLASSTELTRRTLDLLPAPFEWIEIPAGKVTLEAGGYLEETTTFDVGTFYIAKYPLTNAQFEPFIKAKGYTTQRYWTADGWKQCQKNKWTQPAYWNDAKWNGTEHPVVGGSWYECIAYCNWLNNVLKPENGLRVLLPTEQQWQRAAQGNDNRTYPYGNDFDATRANTNESGIVKTTPVRQYEGVGDSPFGVVDMSGNVWEWCLTEYDSGSININ